MKQQLTRISDILDRAMSEFRPSKDLAMTRIWEIWDEAVGDPISKNAKPAAFRDGVLIVHVSSSVWMQQLRFYRQSMLDSINQRMGDILVTDRFKIGFYLLFHVGLHECAYLARINLYCDR